MSQQFGGNGLCHYCQKPGHTAKNCYKNPASIHNVGGKGGKSGWMPEQPRMWNRFVSALLSGGKRVSQQPQQEPQPKKPRNNTAGDQKEDILAAVGKMQALLASQTGSAAGA